MSPHDGPDGGAQWPFVWPYVGYSWIQVIGIESSTMRAHSITGKAPSVSDRTTSRRWGVWIGSVDKRCGEGEWITIRMAKEKR